jgi:hypothetical protein
MPHIRTHPALTSIGFLGKEGEKEAARQLYLL